jgi:nucleoside recognition membrane protein YjiH
LNTKVLTFLLPSFAGILIFLTPIKWNGNTSIAINIVVDLIKTALGVYGLHVVVAITIVTNVLTFTGSLTKVKWIQQRPKMKELFDVPRIWVVIRFAGMLLALMYFFQIGPKDFLSEAVGGAVFVDIGINSIAVFITACLLLPLLTDFGFMEFGGTLARPAFRKAFRLPGRAAIDAATSFVGASSIGLLITISQFNNGNYNAKQACVIATNFSIVSIPFCLVIANVSGIAAYFIPWYGVIVLACLVAAFITPRLPPLSGKAITYVGGGTSSSHTALEGSHSLLSEAWHRAMERAGKAPGIREFFAIGITNTAFFIFSVFTAAMAMASLAMIIITMTPIFGWLSFPFISLLEFAQLPEAAAAAPGMLSGYLDQYAPAVTAKSIQSDATSFVLAGLSVTQLIFMSEAGVIILRSSLPLGVLDLLWIFLLRTAIVLPVLIVGAHVVVG